MVMPKTIAAWCAALFFLWFGLSVFVSFFAAAPMSYVGGLLALGAAVFTFLGR